MARYHRILWSEGLFLTPHLFQQSDLFHADQQVERTALGLRFPWGVRSLEIDTELLATGTFRLLAFRGLLPSGLSVRVPDIDPGPPQLEFGESFDLRADHVDVYLGVPLRRSGWPNCRLAEDAAEDRSEVRYSARAATVDDENTGRGERTIQRAELNLQLLLGTDARDNFECLPIARVEKSAAGGFRLVESFVPPLLALEGSPRLQQLCRAVLEKLVVTSSEWAAGFGESGADARDITPANLRRFLMFSLINGAIPRLAHCRETPAMHPEQVYLDLATLVGQLTTFHASQHHPRDIPAYDHDAPGPVFSRLSGLLDELLQQKSGVGYQVVPLQARGEGRFEARFEKDGLLQPTAAVYLAIGSDELEERDLTAQAMRIIVASPERIEQKLNLNLRGLPLQLVTVPPPAIPRRRNTWLFQLDTRGSTAEAARDWEAIVASRGLAIDVPRDLAGARLELLGLEGA